MKKFAEVLLALLMVMSLVACGNNGKPGTAGNAESAVTSTPAPEAATEPESSEDETDILVAYFSATHTTEGVAELIADGLSADIYEIVPQEPYTDADLDYNDDNSRSTIEMNDPSARPAISGSATNMDQYSIVFIGYPKLVGGCAEDCQYFRGKL